MAVLFLGTKDPQSKNDPRMLDYTDYLAEFGGSPPETIVNSQWTIALVVPPPGGDDGAPLHLDDASIVVGQQKTQCRLSGGTPRATYRVTNHIATSSGAEDERSFDLEITDL